MTRLEGRATFWLLSSASGDMTHRHLRNVPSAWNAGTRGGCTGRRRAAVLRGIHKTEGAVALFLTHDHSELFRGGTRVIFACASPQRFPSCSFVLQNSAARLLRGLGGEIRQGVSRYFRTACRAGAGAGGDGALRGRTLGFGAAAGRTTRLYLFLPAALRVIRRGQALCARETYSASGAFMPAAAVCGNGSFGAFGIVEYRGRRRSGGDRLG